MNAKILTRRFFCVSTIVAFAICGHVHGSEISVNESFVTGDPVRISVARTRVKKLVHNAIVNSPLVREARLLQESAILGITVARSGSLPVITVGAQSTVNTADNQSLMRANGTPMATVSAQIPLYDWGRADAAVRGQRSAATAAHALIEKRQQEIASDAVRACLELERRRSLLAASNHYVQSVAPLVDILKNIANVDQGRSGELVQARSRLLQAESVQQSSTGKVREAEVQLERLVGHESLEDCDDITPEFISGTDLQIARAAVADMPSVRQIDQEYMQQLSVVSQISASRKPQVRLTASYAPINQGLNLYGATLAVFISMPLYDGSNLQATEQAAVERADSLTEKRQQVFQQIDYDVRVGFEQANTQLKTAHDYNQLIIVNEQVRKNFFTQWLSVGKRSLFELLSAEAEHHSLQTGYINALYDAAINYAAVRGKVAMLPGLNDEGIKR